MRYSDAPPSVRSLEQRIRNLEDDSGLALSGPYFAVRGLAGVSWFWANSVEVSPPRAL